MQDKNRNMQVVVLNDRSQGGAVIENGRIELMVNRRLMFDDRRGAHWPLNETDFQGEGIIVPATFWLQIVNLTVQKSQ